MHGFNHNFFKLNYYANQKFHIYFKLFRSLYLHFRIYNFILEINNIFSEFVFLYLNINNNPVLFLLLKGIFEICIYGKKILFIIDF
jgi:hypothetical protein